MYETYGDLKTLFANKYGEETAPSSGVSVRNRFINIASQNIANREKWEWRKKQGTGTTDGTRYFSLADDFSADGFVRHTLEIAGAIWTQINEGEERKYSGDSQIFYVIGNRGEGYDVYFPASTPESSLDVVYRYYRDQAVMVSDSDICIIPSSDAVCDLAVGMYLQSEGDAEEALPFLNAAENGISELKRIDRRSKARVTFENRGTHYGRNVNDIKAMYS